MAHARHRREPATVATSTSDVNVRAIVGFGVGADRSSRAVVHLVDLGAVRLFRRPRRRADARRRYPLAAEQGRARCRRSRGCRPTRARTCADLRAQGRRRADHATAGSTRTPASSAFRSTQAMKLTLERGLPARAEAKHDARRTCNATDTRRAENAIVRGRVLCVVAVSAVSRRRRCADGRRRRDRRLQAGAGHDRDGDAGAAARDRLRPEARRAACRSTRRSATRRGATVTLGDYFGTQAGRPGRSSTTTARCSARRCSTASSSALERAVARRRARTSTSSTVSFDPRETPATGGGEEGELPRALRAAPGADGGWHFLTGDAAVDRAR